MTNKFYGSIVWFIVTLFVIYSFSLNTAAAVFSDAIKLSLHVDNFAVSLATGAFILGFACMQIPAGYLLDKFNARIIVSSGILLLAVGNIIISYSHTLLIFAVSNFLQGIGASFAFVVAAVLISQWFPSKFFPVLFGLTQTFSCIMAGVIHYYFMVILQTHTWNDIYRGIAVFGFTLLILALFFIRNPPNYKRNKNISLKNSLAFTFKNNQILLCSVAAATSFGTLLAYASLWYMKIQEFYSVENLQAAIISSIIFTGIGIGTPLLGWFSNKIKSRVVVIHFSLILGAMILLLGIYMPRYALDSFIIIKIISFLIGFTLSGSMLFYTMVNEIATDATRGVAVSVLNTIVFLFNTLMLFLPYLFITDFSKDFFTHLWLLPFFIMFSLLVLYFIKDTYNMHNEIT